MKKIILTIIYTIQAFCIVSAQSGTIKYNYSINSVKKTSNGLLGFCEAKLYFTDSFFIYSEINPNSSKTETEISKNSENNATVKFNTDEQFLFEYLYNSKTKESFIKDFIFLKKYYYKTKESNPNWILSNEKKKIDTFNCQKATTIFNGRTWIAWFTLDIPYPYGPWKLHGLPGLILEASDTEGKYTFTFTSISNNGTLDKTPLFNEWQNKSINSTQQDYMNIKKKKINELESKAKSFGGSNITGGSFKFGETRDIDL